MPYLYAVEILALVLGAGVSALLSLRVASRRFDAETRKEKALYLEAMRHAAHETAQRQRAARAAAEALEGGETQKRHAH